MLTAKPAGRPLDSRGTPALLDAAVLLRFLSLDCSVTIHSPKFLIGPGTPVELRQYARPKEDPMLRFRKLFSFLAVAVFVVSLLSCGAHDSNEYFVFVAANLQVPYWQAAGAGFSKAASAIQGAL